MLVFETPAEMQDWAARKHLSQKKIAFVPTMGALHDGHIALIQKAKSLGDLVVVSIFVNQLQFNVAADFDKYPRPISDDLSKCRSMGVDAVYTPLQSAMYPNGFDTFVTPGNLANPMEGRSRPGHFQGMATVVAKLFNATLADIAVFGEKDFQQLAIVRAMVADLNMPVEIVGLPTVREADGLALSSRNARLTASNREQAQCIPDALNHALVLFKSGEHDARTLENVTAEIINKSPNAAIDYVQIADAVTLREIDHVTSPAVLAVAVFFDDVRLIDNVLLTP
jgi:pantoate--beta-alanine ligase